MRNTHSKIIAFMFVLQSLNMFKNKRESERTYGEFGFYLVLLLSIVQGGLHGFKLSSFKRSKHILSNFYSFWKCRGRESGQLPRCLTRVKLRSSLLVQWEPQRINILCVPHLCTVHLISSAFLQPATVADLGRLLRLQISTFDLAPYILNAFALWPVLALHFPSLPPLHYWLHRTQRPWQRSVFCHQSDALLNMSFGLANFNFH